MFAQHPSVWQRHSRSAPVCGRDIHIMSQCAAETFKERPNVGPWRSYSAPTWDSDVHRVTQREAETFA